MVNTGKLCMTIANIFRVDAGPDEAELRVPYWAIAPRDLVDFLMGRLEDKQITHVFDKRVELKTRFVQQRPLEGVNLDALTVDTPVPFSLKQMWFELLDPEIRTVTTQGGDIPAKEEDGNAETLTPPKYRAHGLGSAGPFLNTRGVFGIRRQLEHLRSLILDHQYAFLLRPGDLEPDLAGVVGRDLDSLLCDWLGHERPITILDLSGVPSAVLVQLIGSILRVIYEALFWARMKSEGGIERALLVVMEEAHRYLTPDADAACRDMVQRTVKEGRKYGIGAMIVSQRPSEVDETILSQVGNFVALRLSNSSDRSRVRAALPDSLSGVMDMLPVLRTGEAIIVGEAARLPTRCRIFLPDEGLRPDSEDPLVATQWTRGRLAEDYGRLVASWRAQLPRYARIRIPRKLVHDAPRSNGEDQVQRETVPSSSIVSIGYDETAEILEVEFSNGRVYQYYNVPSTVYTEFMSASSKGRFLNYQIKGRFPFSQV
jgi:uncharacterized protein